VMRPPLLMNSHQGRRWLTDLSGVMLSWLLVVLIAWPVGAQLPPPGLEAYRQALDRAVELLGQDEPDRAADLLADITAVTLPSGEVIPVDHSWFIQALRSDGPGPTVVTARLSTLRDELEAWPVVAPAPDAFDRLAEVLARPEFQSPRSPDLDFLSEWLSKLRSFLPALPAVPWLGNLLLLAAAVVLAGVVAYFAAGLWASFVAQAEADQQGAEDVPLTSGQALSRSREMARAGDYRTAVRLLYLSTLLLLEERNLLRYDRTLTNREYLHQVAANPALVRKLRPVVETFDEVWYGQVEPDAGRYEAYARQVEQVREVQG